MRPYLCPSKRIHCRPRRPTPRTLRADCRSSKVLSRISWFTPNTGTKLQCWTTSVRQSNLFQDNKTFKEIIGKESWTLRNHRSSWTSILHITTPRTYESRTPCIACFPIRTLDSDHDPNPNTTPTTSCWSWRWHHIWDCWDPQLQTWPTAEM